MPTDAYPISELDTPQLLIDLDVLDANLDRVQEHVRKSGVDLRVHFKSLKCGGLAGYLMSRGVQRFLCAKLCEAEVLVAAGVRDILVANQIVGEKKVHRLLELSRKAWLSVCVDDPVNVAALGQAAENAVTVLDVLVEVDLGMGRCGVEPLEPALALARTVGGQAGLRFVGLQGYQGHLQLHVPDPVERKQRCLEGLEQLVATRRLLEREGIPVAVVTGAGTGTWDYTAEFPGITEIQPGSFLLMDAAYHAIRPEFACSLSVLTTVISRRPGWYVLDAGSKAISKDFGMPTVKDRPDDRVARLAEEHTRVDTEDASVRVGDTVQVYPAHCCATMNLHRQCVPVRKGHVQAIWPIEASGRYD